ncbi:MAG: transposase [Burkholderiales bacterium]|nr:transposase [Burkholderiales bacterium]
MARLPRLLLPGLPHHVIMRGNNRQAIVADDDDRRFMLELLQDGAAREAVAVHAWLIMDNHLHLLLTPPDAKSLPSLMQGVGRRYVRHFNARQQRSGTLWEGRYRGTVIEPARYLLSCMAYMDLHPVGAGLVADPRDYAWSSHGHYAGLRVDRWLSPHPLVWQLGNTPFAREAAYVDRVRNGVGPAEHNAISRATLNGWVLGTPEFVESLQKQTDRRLSRARPGRPSRPIRNNDD